MADRGSYYEQDRILDNPAVQAVIKASEKVLPEAERDSLSFRPVGDAIIIHGHYTGLAPGTEGILLGVVSTEGVPYSAFTRLRVNHTIRKNPTFPNLRKILTALAMRR